jgi:hypothetical protein
MPYSEWKSLYQQEATPEQMEKFIEEQKKHEQDS